jgi:TolB protein
MNHITHKQALKWIDRRLDGLLAPGQIQLLDEHLLSCDSCRGYAAEMDLLPGRLHSEFHARWDDQSGPSQSIMEYVTSNARRIPMANRFSSGIRWAAGAAALIAMGVFINLVISRLQAAAPLGSAPRAEERLLAFALEQNGDFDIYTLRPDGSERTNLTNDPGQDDLSPFWSPDGRYIAFERERHIFRMDADGSNVIQLTGGEATHRIGQKHGLDSGSWSPDGSKLIFFQSDPGASKWIPYTMDADGNDKQPLVEEPDNYSFPAWSPDGQHIAFLRVDLVNSDGPHLYLVEPDGSNLREVTEFLPENESLWSYEDYYWSREGRSLFFIAWRHLEEGQDQWIAYEFSLADSQLIEKAISSTPMGNWWEGTSFLTGWADDREAPVTWLRPDGTYNTLKPFEQCEPMEQAQYGYTYQRSSHGSLVIAAHCPDGDWWLYWANPDGTVSQQLLHSPISAEDGEVLGFAWSPDDKFLAFNVASNRLTEMYVLDVEAALSDPSVQPLKMTVAGRLLFYNPSWQPIP